MAMTSGVLRRLNTKRIVPARRRIRFGNLAVVVGVTLTVGFLSMALLADWLALAAPFESVAEPFLSPSYRYWFGTDDLGRDVWSGVVHGTRTSLLVGFSVAGAALIIGTLIGSVAGFSGGWLDDVLMRATELVQVMPRFFLALVVVALFGPSLTNLVLVLALTAWASTARLARAGILSIKHFDFVTATRSVGVSEGRILWRHILPNALAPLIVHASLQVGSAMLTEAGLSFIGLGDPNVISWGYLLNNAQPFMRRAWWLALFPGGAIALAVLGVNLLGDGLTDLWNPKLRKG